MKGIGMTRVCCPEGPALSLLLSLQCVLFFSLTFFTTAFADQLQDGETKDIGRGLVFYTALQAPLSDVLGGRLEEACRRSKTSCRLHVVESSARALQLANQGGDGDAMRVANIKEIAPNATTNLFRIDESIIKIKFLVYTKDETKPFTGWDVFRNTKTGFRRGAKVLEKNVPGNPVILPDAKRLFLMLNEGRLDYVIEHRGLAERVIAELALEGIHHLERPAVDLDGYAFIHRKHLSLVPLLEKSISSMKEDGTYGKQWLDSMGATVAE